MECSTVLVLLGIRLRARRQCSTYMYTVHLVSAPRCVWCLRAGASCADCGGGWAGLRAAGRHGERDVSTPVSGAGLQTPRPAARGGGDT